MWKSALSLCDTFRVDSNTFWALTSGKTRISELKVVQCIRNSITLVVCWIRKVVVCLKANIRNNVFYLSVKLLVFSYRAASSLPKINRGRGQPAAHCKWS